MKRPRLFHIFLASCLAASAFAADKASTLVLKRSWIEQFKNRATISGQMFVDHSLSSPKTPSASKPANDGDIHAAGRSAQVGLPMVAEIMNAKDDLTAVKLAVDRTKDHKAAEVTGVWRLWFEHPPSGETQKQDFTNLVVADGTNPDHCFEIHPLVKFEGRDLEKTFHSIPGFKTKDAKESFDRYEKLKLSLTSNADTVSLSSQKVGFNYVKFRLRLHGKPTKLGTDGLQAVADIFEVNGDAEADPLASDVRVVFVNGTQPATEAAKNGAGDEMVVLGIPRVNLNAVSAFVKTHASATGRKLPYEMVILGMEKE